MSISVTLFGPSHYWWRERIWKTGVCWFHRPSKHSSGGTGFCIPFLHVAFYWGRKRLGQEDAASA